MKYSAEERTRQSVARLLLERGPVSAGELADVLGLSAAGIRRHLESMLSVGEATSRPESASRRRGRGRPARTWLLTTRGRTRFGHSYDELAVEALRALRAAGGESAISEFARSRTAAITAGVTADVGEQVGAAGTGDEHRVATTRALARSLSSAGYAASVQQVAHGVQLCQHHCPVAHVAAEFPELCDAEREAFAQVLGTHVQRLATIANGDEFCTTHVPLGGTPGTARRSSTQRPDPVSTSLRKEIA